MQIYTRKLYISAVASFAEAWIEIASEPEKKKGGAVASFAEAWIEIRQKTKQSPQGFVASFAEAWIEIYQDLSPVSAR